MIGYAGWDAGRAKKRKALGGDIDENDMGAL